MVKTKNQDNLATKRDLTTLGFGLRSEMDKLENRVEARADERQNKVMNFLDRVMKELLEMRSDWQIQTNDHHRIVDLEVKLENHFALHP